MCRYKVWKIKLNSILSLQHGVLYGNHYIGKNSFGISDNIRFICLIWHHMISILSQDKKFALKERRFHIVKTV